jgi:transcriptional regulator with XRE-family HTH domain
MSSLDSARLATRLRVAAAILNLTNAETAVLVGTDGKTMGRWMRGTQGITDPDRLAPLAQRLGVPLDVLLGRVLFPSIEGLEAHGAGGHGRSASLSRMTQGWADSEGMEPTPDPLERVKRLVDELNDVLKVENAAEVTFLAKRLPGIADQVVKVRDELSPGTNPLDAAASGDK